MKYKAFTLIEMMIVLSIIAAIFLMIIPDISKTMDVVNQQSCENQQTLINEQILLYTLKYDEMPDDVMDLVNEGLVTPLQCVCKNGQVIEIENGRAVVY